MCNVSSEEILALRIESQHYEEETEKIRLESKLIESKNEIKKYLNSTGIIFIALDLKGEITMINRVGCELFGFAEDQIIGRNWLFSCIPNSHEKQVQKWFDDLQKDNDSALSYLECPILNRKMQNRIIAWHSSALVDDFGKTVGIILSGEDITERKSAENDLKRRELEFRSLAVSLPDIIIRLDLNKRFVFMNRAIIDYTGQSANHYNGSKYKSLGISENICKLLDRTLEWTITTRKPQKVEIIWDTKVGRRYFEIRYVPEFYKENRFKTILGIHHDITDIKRAEQKLRENESKYRVLFEKAPVGIVALDEDGRVTEANQKFFEILQLDVKDKDVEIRAMKIDKIFNSEVKKDIEECQRSGITTVNERPFISKDGVNIQLRYHISPLVDPNYKITGVLIMFEDITDRKLMEIELQSKKEKLDVTIQSIGDALISTDTNGVVLLMNKLAEELTGWKQDQATGVHIDSIFKVQDTKSEIQLDVPVKKVLHTSNIVHHSENSTLISKDGRRRQITYTGTPIKDNQQNAFGIVLVFRDITDKLKFESELLNAQKLESLGILAGGIAHDFNNILAGVLLNIQLSKLRLDEDDKVYKNISEAEDAILRAKGLTQQLLTFAKSGTPIKKTESIKELLVDIANFSLRGSNVVSRFRIAKNLWNAEIDASQVGQVINNLVINSVQAMPNGGCIVINAENCLIDEESSIPLQKGKYIKIAISDEGVGIPESILPSIFDPYFTTKQKGSGLGLATSYSIIKNHEGLILVNSTEGIGTTFTIYLPALGTIQRSFEFTEPKPETLHGNILLMDDDQAIRITLTHYFKDLGLDIESAEDGEQAIYKFRKAFETQNPFDLVILDLTIPGGMGGAEAIKIMREIDNNVKAIVSSGYSTDPIMSNYRDYKFDSVIAKPYELKELKSVIAALLRDA